MRIKLLFVMLLMCNTTIVFSQVWSGSTSTTGTIDRDGDITLYKNYIQRVTIGPAWGGSGMYGEGYIGFNLFRNTLSQWEYTNDGASNGGAVIYGTVIGSINFALKDNSGASSGFVSDADIVNNVFLKVESNRMTYGRDNNIQRVTIGPAWGGSGMYGEGYIGFNLYRNTSAMWDYINDGANNGGAVLYVDAGGSLLFSPKASTGASDGQLSDANVVDNIKFKIGHDGKVVIGDIVSGPNTTISTSTAYDYRLYVEKGILTEKVRVATVNSADWADYVFNSNYKLMGINDLQKYISKNKHLPNIPTAQEVSTDGVDLVQMDTKLLEKVEELTLYIIHLNSEIEKLKKQLNDIQK